jgi:hypothetical protein
MHGYRKQWVGGHYRTITRDSSAIAPIVQLVSRNNEYVCLVLLMSWALPRGAIVTHLPAATLRGSSSFSHEAESLGGPISVSACPVPHNPSRGRHLPVGWYFKICFVAILSSIRWAWWSWLFFRPFLSAFQFCSLHLWSKSVNSMFVVSPSKTVVCFCLIASSKYHFRKAESEEYALYIFNFDVLRLNMVREHLSACISMWHGSVLEYCTGNMIWKVKLFLRLII